MALTTLDKQNDATVLARAFAETAGRQGWSRRSLRAFCKQRGLDGDHLWPRGVRSVARALNDAADEEMLGVWSDTPAASLHEIIMRRFQDNQPLKASVAALATSDALHPIDTLLRTAVTADHMMTCVRSRPAGKLRLVVAYSAAVLVWLGDRSADQAATAKAARLFLALTGLA